MSTENSSNPQLQDEDDQPSRIELIIFLVILGCLGLFWSLSSSSPSTWTMLGFLLAKVALISVVISQACDPFADAAQWVGKKLHLPGSVRGATLDAVASSMPELFSGIFFVVLAISAVQGGDPAAIEQAGAEGYGSTIATCAGSAVYNMILIPAFCAIVIALTRKNRPTIDIEDEVISRDGIWFVGCELLLILFLFQDTMHWWMGIILLVLYGIYILQLYRDAVGFRKKKSLIKEYLEQNGHNTETYQIIEALNAQGTKVSPGLIRIVREELRLHVESVDDDAEEISDEAGLLFGYFSVPLNTLTTVAILSISTVVSAAACYFLVEVTIQTAEVLAVPAFFVAVILAAAASSVPDTLLAIGAARRGDDSGAVSNAFGSNIFDICVCLSIPLLVNSYLTGWQPVTLLQDGKPIAGLMGLRILLVVLTILTLAIMWHNRQLTLRKALALCSLYGIFIAYAVLGSLGVLF